MWSTDLYCLCFHSCLLQSILFSYYIYSATMFSSIPMEWTKNLLISFLLRKVPHGHQKRQQDNTDWVHQQLLWQHRHFSSPLSHSFLSTAHYLPFTKPSSLGGMVKHLILLLCYIYKTKINKINNRHHLKRQTRVSSLDKTRFDWQ